MRRRSPDRRGRDPRRGQRGFTMMELLVTLAVSVIGLTGMMALQLATTRGNQGAAQASEAVTIAQRTIEEARGKSEAQLIADYAATSTAPLTIDHDFGGQTVTGRTTTYFRRLAVDVTGGSNDLLKFRVEVIWADDGANINDLMHRHQVSVELLRTRQEAF